MSPLPVSVGSGINATSELVALNVTVCVADSSDGPALTVVIRTDTASESSLAVTSGMRSKLGASSTAVTVTSNDCCVWFTLGDTDDPSSSTLTRTVATPFASATGESTRSYPTSDADTLTDEISSGLKLAVENVSPWPASSAPPPGPICPRKTVVRPASSSMVRSVSVAIVGASLIPLTVIGNVRVAVAMSPGPAVGPPSSTTTVIVTKPASSATGAYVSAHVAPLPDTVGSGTMLGSLLVAVTLAVWLDDSSDPPPTATLVMATDAAPESSSTDWSATGSKDGASFTAFTVMSNVWVTLFTLGAVPEPVSAPVSVIVTVPLASATGE